MTSAEAKVAEALSQSLEPPELAMRRALEEAKPYVQLALWRAQSMADIRHIRDVLARISFALGEG